MAKEKNKETEINLEENEVKQEKKTENSVEERESEETAENKKEETDPLEEANAKIEELKDKYLRSVAEFDNYRKRTMKEKTELILNGSEKTITAILPILDDMERAIANADKTDDIKAVKEGVELIFSKFKKTLEGLGVKQIETVNADFDTDFHEAIAMIPNVEDEKKGKVLDCVQTGYTLNDKVIRHAKVAVGQ